MNSAHIVINSNKWFSAVSDYSLQLAKFLKTQNNVDVLYGAHSVSPMHEKFRRAGIQTTNVPLLPSGLLAFILSWRALSQLLKQHHKYSSVVVWVFEGREHTLCALHKKVCRHLWRNAVLVRVRGQAAEVKALPHNNWLYTQATDRVVFAAEVVKSRTPLTFDFKKARVFLYCAGRAQQQAQSTEQHLPFFPGVPDIDFLSPLFLVVGRYDPVKGHDLMLKAFASARFAEDPKIPVQLVFVGESQNVQASDLYRSAVKLLGANHNPPNARAQSSGPAGQVGTRYFASSPDGLKKVFIFDERLPDLSRLMSASHFGVIPSFASEVICRVAVEFMQAGTPLLASSAGALPEVIHTKTEVIHTPCGVLFEPESEAELTAVLEQAYVVLLDDAKHAKMRHSARARGKDFELTQFAELVKWVNHKPV